MDIDQWARSRIADLEAQAERQRRLEMARAKAPRPLEDDFYTLEYNFARALLLLQSMLEVCHRKGVFTREELSAMAQELDMLDGKADGALDPAQVAGMRARPSQSGPSSVEGFLNELRRRDDGDAHPEFKIKK